MQFLCCVREEKGTRGTTTPHLLEHKAQLSIVSLGMDVNSLLDLRHCRLPRFLIRCQFLVWPRHVARGLVTLMCAVSHAQSCMRRIMAESGSKTS